MTFHSPTLILTRLLIIKSEKTVYDETYHQGVNVIRGTNSSGKTTISRAIAYVMGMDIKSWTPELLLCDHVVAELLINGEFLTVRRPIKEQQRAPMEIFWGKYPASTEANISSWERYPYQATKSMISFSQALFNLMGMPEVKGHQESNITMHQIMRLMYGDQSSSASSIMVTEAFDSTNVREAVGDLLCGIYDDELYNSTTELSLTERLFDKVHSELKSLWKFLGQTHSDIKSLDIEKAILEKQETLAELYSAIEAEKVSNTLAVTSPKQELDEVKKELKESKDALYRNEEESSTLKFEFSDSEIFINELEHKVASLSDSINTAEVIDQIGYKNCPSCMSELTKLKRSDDQCRLCGSNVYESAPSINLHRIKNEVSLQIKESIQLQNVRIERLNILETEISALQEKVKLLENRYKDLAVDIGTEQQKILQSYYRQVGYLEREVENLAKNKEIIDQVEKLTAEKEGLGLKISELKELIATRRHKQSELKLSVASLISKEVVSILHNDLDRQKEFAEADYINFDFGKNSVSVDGANVFSESSTVFLKNAFLLGLLSASAKDSRMRLPRFLLLDGIENGGMEQGRSHNLQKLILRVSDDLTVDHQIILTTAEIAPEIEGTAATVGAYYSVDEKSLNFSLS